MAEEQKRLDLITYINSPSGKGVGFTHNKIIKDALEKKYNDLKVKHKFISKTCVTKEDVVYILVKVPSESINMYYDVLLQFTPDEGSSAGSIKKHSIKFFSNCPSYVYTYAYAFNQNGLSIPQMHKLIHQAVSTEAVEKNMYNIVGYEKSLYYACRYVEDNLTNINTVRVQAQGIKLKNILDDIRDFDDIMDENKQEHEILREKNKNKTKIAKSIKRSTDKKKNNINSNTSILANKDKVKFDKNIHRQAKVKGSKRGKVKATKTNRKK